MRADVCELRASVRHAASAETADSTRCILGHARRLSHVASEIVKRNENPFRKRTLRNIVRQFNKGGSQLFSKAPFTVRISSGDIELTRCKSTVKAICFGLVNSAIYPDQ